MGRIPLTFLIENALARLDGSHLVLEVLADLPGVAESGEGVLVLKNDGKLYLSVAGGDYAEVGAGGGGMTIHSLDLGSPAAASATAIHAAVTLTGSAQLGIAATVQPFATGATYGRTVSITTSFPSDDGVADKVTVHSHNPDGTVISEDIPYTDATGETVVGVKAHYGTLTFDLPAKGAAAAGTISVGTNDSGIGLGRLFPGGVTVLVAWQGGVVSGNPSYFPGAFSADATHYELNYWHLSLTCDGTPLRVDAYY